MNADYVVFLPGLMCDERLFDGQTNGLPVAHQIAALTQSDSISGMARDVLASAPKRFAAIGLSMGGIVALELWRQAPQRISHMMLLDTSPYADPPEKQQQRLALIQKAAAGGLRKLAAEELKPLYLGSKSQDDQALLDCIVDMAMQHGPAVFESQSLALKTRPDATTTLATIDVPAAVVCGAEDVLCPPETHQFMAAEIPAATLSIIPGCGHMATMERPDEVRELMNNLLAR